MRIGFIGAGNMGGAILSAISGESGFETAVYEKSSERIKEIKKEGKSRVAASIPELIDFAEAVLIAVKPVHIDALLKDIVKCRGYENKIYISIAAGVKVERFTDVLGNVPVARVMPNLPAMVREGFTGIYYHGMDDESFAESRADIKRIFDTVGMTYVLASEAAVDKIISVTSSSPAYICLMIEALADGAVRAGFGRAQAYEMAEQTVYGTAKYLLETGLHPAVLKDQVCSPAGTTIEAVASLEKNGFRSALLEAMDVCERKAEGRLE